MHKLVLLRHGESQWNLENRFTGWHDVNLTEQGEKEGREAGRLLKAEGFEFDVAYTSVLTRAIRTLWLALTEMDQVWIPVHREWRLNERHYGALQGLNKAETAESIMQDIHEKGSAVVAVLPYEMAEQKGVEVTVMARGAGFPLQVKLEPDN